MVRSLKFIRETSYRWFVELPEWTGSKDDLEMVMGADTMLDCIAGGENEVIITFSTIPIIDRLPKYELTLKEEIYEGASYDLTGMNMELEVWLCYVTKSVFGNFPYKIYLY